MRLLICGGGYVARELLKRLGERWQVTVVDPDEENLQDLATRFKCITNVVSGDPSSPVVLDKAEINEQDYVIALSGDDAVNLAVTRFARENMVKHVLTMCRSEGSVEKCEQTGAKVFPASMILAKNMFHYLQNPEVSVSKLVQGKAELLEIEVTPQLWAYGRKISSIEEAGWRIVALLRNDELTFPGPEIVIAAGDILIIIGHPDLLQPVCNLMDCGTPHFPLVYGQGLLLCITDPEETRQIKTLNEGLHLAQNTQTENVTILCEENTWTQKERLKQWSDTLDIHLECVTGAVQDQIPGFCESLKPGLVVIRPFSQSLLKTFTSSPLVGLAHTIKRPVLIARGSDPYQRILVPFSATPGSEGALAVALDLKEQFDAEVTVVVVEEPEFFHGHEDDDRIERAVRRARDIAHAQQHKIKEVVLQGNPVKEITTEAKDYDLVVLGSDTKVKNFFTPHVSELVAQKAPCSVLILST